MLVGASVALRKDDIKALLAYSTVSLLGTMVLLAGVGGPEAPAALMATVLAHALYKGSLFLVAGAVDHEAGTRKLSELGGLRRVMPATFAIACLAAISMAGIPPLFGFVAKEELLYAVTESGLPAWLGVVVSGAVVVAGALSVVYAWRLIRGIFLGERGVGVNAEVHEAPTGMLAGPGLLTLLTVALPLGFLPLLEELLAPAVRAVGGLGTEIDLYLIPASFGLPVILSIIAIGGGLLLTRIEGRLVSMRSPLPAWLNGDRIYDATVNGLLDGTTAFTRVVQNGRLRTYLLWSILALVAAVLPPLALYGLADLQLPSFAGIAAYELVAALLIPVGVLATVTARSRLGAIIAAGIVGAMVAFLFVIYSAPDLALTQLLIEVIATVFFLLVFAVLPPAFEKLSPRRTHLRDLIVAAVLGITMAGVTYVAASSTELPRISATIAAESLSEGFGANIVNVILVDFRGFDTLGEITVLFAALLGIYAMLRLRPISDPTPMAQRGDSREPAPTRHVDTPASEEQLEGIADRR